MSFWPPKIFLDEIFKLAERDYPRECCGFILGPRVNPLQYSRLRSCRNAQDYFYQPDTEQCSRDSRRAYFVDPFELLNLHKELRNREEDIRIIYHSHIDQRACFSQQDQRQALLYRQPLYSCAKQLVVSVCGGHVRDFNLFKWSEIEKKFKISSKCSTSRRRRVFDYQNSILADNGISLSK